MTQEIKKENEKKLKRKSVFLTLVIIIMTVILAMELFSLSVIISMLGNKDLITVSYLTYTHG